MTTLHVCPWAHVETGLASSGAGWVVSLLALTQRLPDLSTVASEHRLHLAVSDITRPTPEYILAETDHLAAFFAFLRRWDRATPMLIHCYAGVSRSTAAAFVALCFLDPDTTETEHARRLRAAAPTATPNRRIVELAGEVLARNGRMIAAVAAIGRGIDCFEGVPFSLTVRNRSASDAMLDVPPPQPA